MQTPTPRRKHADPTKQSPKVAQPPVQVLDPNAEAKGETMPTADPLPVFPPETAQFARFSLLPALAEVNPDWDARLRQPILETSEELSDAIGLVQRLVKTTMEAFPADAEVEGILINDAGLVQGKLDGRGVFVFVDTVSGGALQLYGPGGELLPLQSPSKGRAIVADGCAGFALDPTHGRTPRTVLLFRLAAKPDPAE
jgi:hypothetical protein